MPTDFKEREMRAKRIIVSIVAVVLALLGGMNLWGPSRVPPGQEPLVMLSSPNFIEFEKAFDAVADVPG